MDTTTKPHSASRRDLDLLAEVLDHGVREPLAALRATLEAFARRNAGGGEATLARAALAQVVGLSRTVQDLSALASPPPIRPMRCTVEEIVRGALGELDGAVRPRVLLALEHPRKRLHVDGPLLSRCLAHLMADGLHAEAECMLHVRRIGGRTQFVILHTPPVESELSGSPLGRAIASRDLDRMGGSLVFRASPDTSTSIVDGLSEADLQEAAA